MSSFADGKFENQSIYTIKNNKVNDHKNDYMYAHPKVIQWLCDSDLKYEGSKHINCSNYIQNAQKAFKNINEIGINSLVDAYSITTNQADKLYEKKKKLHGVKFKNKKQWDILNKYVEETVAHIRRSPPIVGYWASPCKNKYEFKKIFSSALRHGKKHLSVSRLRRKIPAYKFVWIKGKPEDIAAFDPDKRTIYVHEWAVAHFRKCDIIIIALHEILGHHLQELSKVVISSKDAESCGMQCEQIILKMNWKDDKGKYHDLRKCMYQWQLFRLVRAQVDLRLHASYVRKITKNMQVDKLWDIDPSLKNHIVPLPTETIRCASIPAQAQTYVSMIIEKAKKYKLCKC